MMVRLASWVFHTLPLPWVLAFGRLLGRIAHGLGIRRRIVDENLQLAFPDLGPRERCDIARRMWLGLGTMAVEFLRSPRMTPEEVRRLIELDGWEHLERARAAGKGVIVVTGHFGNWELLATASAILGLPLHVISRRMSRRRINRWWKEARARAGLHDLPDRGSARRILRVLKRGEVLGVAFDQNIRPPAGTFVSFFGVPAATIRAPVTLAEATGAALVTAFLVRLGGGRHRLVVRPFEYDWSLPDREARQRHNPQRLSDLLEAQIRAHPDHWMWLHRRWKSQPTPGGGYVDVPSVAALLEARGR